MSVFKNYYGILPLTPIVWSNKAFRSKCDNTGRKNITLICYGNVL